jgi:hypothetical protein
MRRAVSLLPGDIDGSYYPNPGGKAKLAANKNLTPTPAVHGS